MLILRSSHALIFRRLHSIPLAKKLKDCGIFGVSSDEYLNYALENRQEWEAKGESIVKSLVEKYADREKAPIGMVL